MTTFLWLKSGRGTYVVGCARRKFGDRVNLPLMWDSSARKWKIDSCIVSLPHNFQHIFLICIVPFVSPTVMYSLALSNKKQSSILSSKTRLNENEESWLKVISCLFEERRLGYQNILINLYFISERSILCSDNNRRPLTLLASHHHEGEIKELAIIVSEGTEAHNASHGVPEYISPNWFSSKKENHLIGPNLKKHKQPWFNQLRISTRFYDNLVITIKFNVFLDRHRISGPVYVPMVVRATN